jgi:hypothetical protein
MQSNGTRIAALLVTLAVVVVLFFVFKGGDDDNDSTGTSAEATTTQVDQGGGGTTQQPSKPDVPVIKIVDGQPKGGVADLEFTKGEDVRFAVDSDTADEIHVHGYDIGKDVAAGGTVKFDFPADIDGVFEVELEAAATQIAELTVNP